MSSMQKTKKRSVLFTSFTVLIAFFWMVDIALVFRLSSYDSVTDTDYHLRQVNPVNKIQKITSENLSRMRPNPPSNDALKSTQLSVKTPERTNHFLLLPKKIDQGPLHSIPSWSWPIIHIVSTRFMQNQGSLVSLARARLKLLEVVCLPSIRKQTIFDHDILRLVYRNTLWREKVEKLKHLEGKLIVDPLFLWIIKVDPNLNKSVLEELKVVLEPVKHFAYVVGSNSNFGIGVNPGSWRDGKAGEDIFDAFQNDRVYFPRNKELALETISRAHQARSDRVILETRLDADDAINLEYFSILQYSALKSLMDRSITGFVVNDDEFEQGNDDDLVSNLTETARWIYWCPHRHIQWTPASAFFNPNNDPGLLSVLESPFVCVTSGLTLGFAVGTEELTVPRYEHTQIYWEININHYITTADVIPRGEINKHDCGLYPSSRCAVFIENPSVSAFRSRAMTSAGMHMMEAMGQPTLELFENYTEISRRLWNNDIEEYFGIEPEKAKHAAEFMMNIYVDTVRDNLRGQCTNGHSCKISTMEKLQKTIDVLEEEIGGIEIA